MGSVRRLGHRLVQSFRHQRSEEDLAREMAAHLAVLEDEYQRQGMTPEDAKYAARRAMGGVEQAKEHHRQVRAYRWMDDLQRDIQYAGRTLRRDLLFTFVAILTLAVGIGANTAVYSTIDAAFFRPLPFTDPDRLVRLDGVFVPLNEPPTTATRVSLTDLGAVRDVFAKSAAYATGGWNLGSGVEPVRVQVTFASAEFFETLGHHAFLGRTFAEPETRGDGRAVTVLSHRLWRAQFGSDLAIVGDTISLNELDYQVIGVMPQDFRFPADAQLWVPLPVPYPESLFTAFRNYLPSIVIARLTEDVTLPQASERLHALRPTPPQAESPADSVTPLHRWLVGDRRFALALLMASAALVLLVACANVANLLLARAAGRRRELAMRAALGASRGRLLRQLLAESLVLALLGSGGGLLLARVALPALAALVPRGLAGLAPIQIDGRVLVFTLAVGGLTAVLFGLWPVIGATPDTVGEALTGQAARRRSGKLGGGLVVAEVALACLLAVGAGLMLTSLRALVTTDVGMRIGSVATARLNLSDGRYASAAARTAFIRAVLDRLRQAPGVEQAAAINTLPFAQEGGIRLAVLIEGRTPDPSQSPYAPYLKTSPGYFQTMGMPLLSGRDLAWRDNRTQSVAVINQTLARRLWPGRDPLGQQFVFAAGPDLTVVGVVGDAHTDRLDAEILPQVYLPIQDRPESYLSIVARGPDVGTVLGHLRTAVRTVDPALPVYAAESLQTVIGATIAPRRTNTLLMTAFGVLALGLAAVGIYGVLAYAVTERTREIGIRMALGAHRPDVLRLVIRQGLTLTAIGIGVGLAAALATTRFLESMLFGVSPLDPLTWVAVPMLFLTAALLASYLPAHRATKVDPLVALKYE